MLIRSGSAGAEMSGVAKYRKCNLDTAATSAKSSCHLSQLHVPESTSKREREGERLAVMPPLTSRLREAKFNNHDQIKDPPHLARKA